MEMTGPDRSSAMIGALDVPLDLPLAHVGTRALAVLVDMLVLVAVLVTVFAAAVALGPALGPLLGGWGVAILMWAVFLLYWGYFAVSEQLMGGQTLGKKLLALRVVGTDGTDVGLLASLVRNLLRVIDLLPGTYGVGVATMLVSRRGQRLGDMAAGTVVVRERSGHMDTAAAAAGLAWPPGFEAEDVSLVERYFRLRGTLRAEASERIERRLVEWLRRDHPGAMAQVPPDWPASTQLQRVFSAATQPGPGGAELR